MTNNNITAKNIVLVICAALALTFTAACTGDRGPQGVAGEKGDKGTPGRNGDDGNDGVDGNDGNDGTNGNGNNGGTTGSGWTLCEYSSQMEVIEGVALDIAEGVRDGNSYTQNCGNPSSNNGNVIYVAVNNDTNCGNQALVLDPQDNNWSMVVGYASESYTDSNTVSSNEGFNWVEIPIQNDKGDCVVAFQLSNGNVNVSLSN